MAPLLVLLALGCGPKGGTGFDDGGNDPDSGDQADGDNPFPDLGDGDMEAAPPCVGLKCQQVACGGGVTTTVSGTVFDPAGKNPLYNVVVYVPNAPLDPIAHGPVCDSCGGAPISGNPVVTTLTDTKGKFVLKDVPAGSSIPLVIQVGKWRRKITIPVVNQCTDTPLAAAQTRLPAKKSEGDMPLIALAAGCDPIHTLVQKIGIDPSEFTNGAGNGMVHVYAGQSNQNGGVANATSAYAFWGNLAEMKKHDIIINECECGPYPRDTMGPAYTNMRQYLDSGGRVFSSHYHLNFFGSSSENGGKADMELQQAATWTLWGGSGGGTAPWLIDTSFPKGKAMDEWLTNLPTVPQGWGPTIKTTPKGQINTFAVGDIGPAKPNISQRWIYPTAGNSIAYLSFNLPTNVQPDKRCGRAVGTDMHVGNGSLTSMTEQEAALEFMFFDLASCVIDDQTPPAAPPPK